MACDGKCTFESTVSYEVDANNRVIGFTWSSSRSETNDCLADMREGWGWFKFIRTTDASTQSIDRDSINASDPNTNGNGQVTQPDNAGRQSITAGVLPPGVSVTATAKDYIAIDVKLPPNAPAPAQFKVIDLNFALETECTCGRFKNRKELVVRFLFDASAARGSEVKHSKATRSTAPGNNGINVVTFTWRTTEVCDKNEIVHPSWDKLRRWKELDKKAGPTEAEKQEKSTIEQGFQSDDANLENNSLLSVNFRIWKRSPETSVATLLNQLEVAARQSDLKRIQDLIPQIRSALPQIADD